MAYYRCDKSLTQWPNSMSNSIKNWNNMTCFQYNNGTFISCLNSTLPTGVGLFFSSNVMWVVNSSYTSVIATYRICSQQCPICTGINNPDWNCTTCNNTLFKWNGWPRCWPFCPTYAITASSFTAAMVGQYNTTYNVTNGGTCTLCDSRCNFCNGPALTNCFSCTAGYYLIGDQAACTTAFSTVGYAP